MTPATPDSLRTDLAASDFAPHVATAFTLWLGDRPVPLVLDSADGAGADPERSFVLRFTAAEALAQGTYPVEHEAVGHMAIFLVPVDAAGTRYEAVFNRSTTAD